MKDEAESEENTPDSKTKELKSKIDQKYSKIIGQARLELKDFHGSYNQQVNHIMGFLVQIENLATHVYNQRRKGSNTGPEAPSQIIQSYLEIIDEGNQWYQIENMFVKEYCRLQGMS